MYVCICNNVRESDIDSAVAAGAKSLSCIKQELGVASCCGQCEELAAQCTAAALRKQHSPTLRISRITNAVADVETSWASAQPAV
ncbi:MAG: (2Fe-2S)-binding protein [Pseudomonadota bacterium]